MNAYRLFTTLVLLLCGQLAQAQTTRFVSTTGTNTNPATATSWATSTTNLQGAINASASGDEVWVARGTYTPTQDINGGTGNAQTRTFRIRSNVKVYGGFEGYESSIDDPNRAFGTPVGRSPSVLSGGGNSYHVVSFSQVSNCRLDGFTIRSGNASGTGADSRGAGIYNDGSGTVILGGSSTPNLANCFIEQNQATGEGAGMYNDGQTFGIASPYLTNCTFFDNTATGNGGAVTNVGSSSGSASPEFVNCLFVQNAGNSGGAVYNMATQGQVSPRFTDCSFSRNNALGSSGDGAGGGMYTRCFPGNATIVIERCQFLDNTANLGAAIQNLGWASSNAGTTGIQLFLHNSVISRNRDRNGFTGGAVRSYGLFGGGNLSVLNCTFYDNNTSSVQPNASFNPIFFVNDGPPYTSSLTIKNSIFWKNGTPIIALFNTTEGVSVSHSNLEYCFSYCGTNGNVSIDPGFISDPLSLTTGSPLIDAGDPTNTTFTVGNKDFPGNPRIVGCAVDMGAYENQSSTGQRLAITGSPVAVAVACPGNAVSVPVSYTGTVIGFQWYKGTTPVSSQTTATLSIPSATAADVDIYSLVITGACNSVTSTAFSLSLTNPPTRLYVKANATGLNTGLSWPNAFTSLQSALTYPCSQSVTEIWVAAGMYKPTQTTGPNSRTVSFTLTNNIPIYGGFVGSETALSGRPALNPATGQPSSSTLSGEIGNPASTTDNTIHLIVTDNTPVLDGFVITSGRAEGTGPVDGFGGGLFVTGTPQIRNCLFTGNYSFNDGAGVYVSSGTPTFTDCVFRSNNARRWGGGAKNENGTSLFNRCLFEANEGGLGGAMDNAATTTLTNCVFRQNQARESGGAIANRTSHLTITNCTFLSNTALGQASGIPAGGAIATSGNAGPNVVTISNTIFWDNGGAITIANVNNPSLTTTYSLFEPSVTGLASSPTNLTTNTSPFTGPGSFSLGTCSPAIDAGDPATTSALVGITDLVSEARFSGSGRVDIGAVEFQGISPFVSIVSGPATGSLVCVGGSVLVLVVVDGAITNLQWFNAGGAVSGQTSSTLNLSNLTVGTGSYSLVATSSCNSVTSMAFNLTVATTTITLTQQPGSGSGVCEGGAVSFWAGVTGISGFTSAWYKDGNLLGAGGQSLTLNLSNVQTAQAGQYVLVATGACNSVTTSPAFRLTVNLLPVVTLSFPLGTTVVGPGSGVATITLPPGSIPVTFQASGGVGLPGAFYEFTQLIDRINGYEIRQVDSNQTGIFTINRLGPFTLTVTGAGGCKRTVQGVME